MDHNKNKTCEKLQKSMQKNNNIGWKESNVRFLYKFVY